MSGCVVLGAGDGSRVRDRARLCANATREGPTGDDVPGARGNREGADLAQAESQPQLQLAFGKRQVDAEHFGDLLEAILKARAMQWELLAGLPQYVGTSARP